MAYDTTHSTDDQTYTDLSYTSASGDAVLTSGDRNTYNNCTFGAASSGHGLAVSGDDNVYNNCVIEDNGTDGGIVLSDGATGTRFINCVFYNNTGAPDLSAGAEFVNCAWHSNGAQAAVAVGQALKGSNNLVDGYGVSRTVKPSDVPTLDSAHALFSNWVIYNQVDQASGDLINIADRTLDGSLSGAAYGIEETGGRVVTFDGTSDWVSYGAGVDPAGYSSWSIGLRFRVTSLATLQMLVSKLNTTGTFQFQLYVATNGDLFCTRYNTSDAAYLSVSTGSGRIVVNTWYTVVISMTEGVNGPLHMYLETDSVVSDSSSTGTKDDTATADFRIGARADGLYTPTGQVKYFFLSDTAMSAGQAAAWILDPASPLKKSAQVPKLNTGLAWSSDIVLAVGGGEPFAGAINAADRTTDGTLVGNTRYIKDSVWGHVFDFDGTGDYISMGTGFDISGYTGWSFGIVFKANSFPALGQLFTKFDTGAAMFDVYVNTGGDFFFRRLTNVPGVFLTVSKVATLSTNTWYTVVGTCNETGGSEELNLYIDELSVETDTTTDGTASTTGTAEVMFGERADGGGAEFDGQIAMAFLASTELTAAQAAAWIADPYSIFSHEPSVDTAHRPVINANHPELSGLSLYYNWGQGAGTTVTNLLTPGTNDTTFQNMDEDDWEDDAVHGPVADTDGSNDFFSAHAMTTTLYGWVLWIKIPVTITTASAADGLFGNAFAFTGVFLGAFTGSLTNEIYGIADATGDGPRVGYVGAAETITAGWHQLAGRWDGTKYLLYVDGALIDEGDIQRAGTAQLCDISLSERIGYVNSGNYTAGKWGSLQLFGVSAPSAAFIASDYASQGSMLVDSRKRETRYTLAQGHDLYANVTRCYAMSERLGTNVEDLTGTSDGTLTGDATWIVNLDGDTGVEMTGSVNSPGTKRINCGTTPYSGANAGAVVFRTFNDSFANFRMLINDGQFMLYEPDGTGVMRVTFDAASTTSDSSAALTADQWQNVVATWDATGTVNIWVDGVQVLTDDSTAGTPTAGTTDFMIGNDFNGGNMMDGYMAFVATLDVELTDAQAKSLSLNPYQLLYEHEQAWVNTSVFDDTTAIGDIYEDAANADYTPTDTDSPAFDAGVAVSGRTTDFDGGGVPKGTAPDIGPSELGVGGGGARHAITVGLRI